MVFGGSNYLMAWTDAASQHPASGNDVYAQFINSAGNLVGAAFPVSGAAGDQAARGAAFDGTNFLVIWSAADGLRGRRLSAAGNLLPGELEFTTEDVQEAAAVAYGNDQYFVTWVEGTDGAHVAKGRMVSPSGQLGGVLLLSQTSSYFYNPISVAYGGGRFLAVWHHNADDQADWNLRGRMVLPDGTLASSELPLAAGPADELAWANNVVFDGNHFLVVWTQAESPSATNGVVRGQYWTTSGLTHGSPFTIDDTARSKLGLGLSGANGQVLAVVNTEFMASKAGVCARTISQPTVAMRLIGPRSVQIAYTGVLQYSTNLTAWMDYSPQPVSPWTIATPEAAMFFRSR